MTSHERREWLEDRKTGVTATDIRRLVIPYRDDDPPQAALIFDEKTGPTVDREPSPLMAMGLGTEDYNASLYEKRSGFALLKPSPITRHVSVDWMIASLDRTAVSDGRPVELKYCGPFFSDEWGEEYTDAIPLGYVIQTTWQMGVTAQPWCDVSALCGTGDHRVYRIAVDLGLLDTLVVIGRDFWSMVADGARPATDWVHPLAEALSVDLETRLTDRTVTLGADVEFAASEWLHLKSVENEAGKLADEVKAGIAAKMGDATDAVAGRFKITRKPRAKFVREIKPTKGRFR